MNYHINTMVIIDNYKKQSECPLCDIEAEAQTRLIEQFCGEAVMIDEYRHRVNKEGFCKKHLTMIYDTPNKLGTALQLFTRLKHIHSEVSLPKSVKTATAQHQSILNNINSCVICSDMQDIMNRYYQEICKLYHNEQEFRNIFAKGKGHCMKHYAMLLKNSTHSKNLSEQFLKDLYVMQDENMKRLFCEIDWFCDKFDYRNRDKPMGTSADAVKRGMEKMHGK